jgi:hypothetical protein
MSTKQYVGSFAQLADGVVALGKVLTLKPDDVVVWATPANTSPWNLENTSTDAVGDKTTNIERYGTASAISFNTKKNIIGSGITGYNKWWKVFEYAVGSPSYQGASFTVQLNEGTNQNISTIGKSITFDILLHGHDTFLDFINVNVKSGVTTFDLTNFEVLFDSATRKVSFYYRPTFAAVFSNWLVLNADIPNTTVLAFTNTLIGVSLSGEPNDTIISKTISLNKVNGAYTLPSTAPTVGQVLGYSSAGVSDWSSITSANTTGATGSFTSNDGKTITVTNGLITSIV